MKLEIIIKRLKALINDKCITKEEPKKIKQIKLHKSIKIQEPFENIDEPPENTQETKSPKNIVFVNIDFGLHTIEI